MPPTSKTSLKYIHSDQYKEEIFRFWYKNRHLGATAFNAKVPPDENNQKVTHHTVQLWITEYLWEERAASLDLEVINRMDTLVIDERIRMFQEHAEIGREIKDFGLSYLRGEGIKSDMAALRAISDGIQIERSSRGLADSLARLAQMDDTTLLKEINKLLATKQNTIDTEVEDITSPDEDSK